VHGEEKKYKAFSGGNGRNLGDIGLDERIILKLIGKD
jgi:hypothetical protein